MSKSSTLSRALDWTTDQVDNNIHVNNLTPITLTTVQTAANQSAQLALTAEAGDIVVRTDEKKTYCHNGGTASNMNDFTELQSPTDAVTSVSGATGVVADSDIDHDSLANFAANEHFVQSAITSVGTLTSLALSGNITVADDTSIGISDSDERIEFDGAGDISFLGANVGIGTTTPGSARLSVNQTASGQFAAYFSRGINETGSNSLVQIIDSNANNAQNALYIQQVGNANSIYVDQDGNGRGIFVDNAGTMAGIEITDTGTGKGMQINNSNAEIGLLVSQTAGSPALYIDQDGASEGIYIDQDGNGRGITIANASLSDGILINNTNTSNSQSGLEVLHAGTGAGVLVSGASAPHIAVTDTTSTVTSVLQCHDDRSWVGTTTNHALHFITNNTERMAIMNDGTVHVNGPSTTANRTFEVKDRLSSSSSTYPFVVYNNAGNANLCYLRGDGEMWIGGDLTENSDRNMKENISYLSEGLGIINDLKPATFDVKSEYGGKKNRAGFIAQDVELVLPHAVKEADEASNNMKSLAFNHFMPYMVKAIQELSAKVTALENA